MCGLCCLNEESSATQVTQGPYAVRFEHMHTDVHSEGIDVVFLLLPSENKELKYRGPTANFEYFWEKVEPIHPLWDKVFERLGL